MNYAEARQLADGSGWHWTSMNDGRVRPAWPCRRYVGDATYAELLAGKADPSDRETCSPHATREDAERHWYDACLEVITEGDLGDWSGCRVCDTPTKQTLGNRPMGMRFPEEPLCDAHRTRDQLAALHPFQPGASVIHS